MPYKISWAGKRGEIELELFKTQDREIERDGERERERKNRALKEKFKEKNFQTIFEKRNFEWKEKQKLSWCLEKEVEEGENLLWKFVLREFRV